MKRIIRCLIVSLFFCASMQASVVYRAIRYQEKEQKQSRAAVKSNGKQVKLLYSKPASSFFVGGKQMAVMQKHDLSNYVQDQEAVSLIAEVPSFQMQEVKNIIDEDNAAEGIASGSPVAILRSKVASILEEVSKNMLEGESSGELVVGLADVLDVPTRKIHCISPGLIKKIAALYQQMPSLGFYLLYWVTRAELKYNELDSMRISLQQSVSEGEGSSRKQKKTFLENVQKALYQTYFQKNFKILEKAKRQIEQDVQANMQDKTAEEIWEYLRKGGSQKTQALNKQSIQKMKEKFIRLPVFLKGIKPETEGYLPALRMFYLESELEVISDQISSAQVLYALQDELQKDGPREIIVLLRNEYAVKPFLQISQQFDVVKEAGSGENGRFIKGVDLQKFFTGRARGNGQGPAVPSRPEALAVPQQSIWQRIKKQVSQSWSRLSTWAKVKVVGAGAGLAALVAYQVYAKKMRQK